MQFKDRIRVQHILNEANEACKYVEGISFDGFVEDGKTVRAVIRSIEVIGEAASKISIEFRKEHSDVPWQKTTCPLSKMRGRRDGLGLPDVWQAGFQ